MFTERRSWRFHGCRAGQQQEVARHLAEEVPGPNDGSPPKKNRAWKANMDGKNHQKQVKKASKDIPRKHIKTSKKPPKSIQNTLCHIESERGECFVEFNWTTCGQRGWPCFYLSLFNDDFGWRSILAVGDQAIKHPWSTPVTVTADKDGDDAAWKASWRQISDTGAGDL